MGEGWGECGVGVDGVAAEAATPFQIYGRRR